MEIDDYGSFHDSYLPWVHDLMKRFAIGRYEFEAGIQQSEAFSFEDTKE